MRSVEFHPDAQNEFISAAQFYESQTEGLGLDFIAAVQHAYGRLAESPASGGPFGRRLRRLLLPKFPYGLLYRVEPERIYVIAVMHLHRRPVNVSVGQQDDAELTVHLVLKRPSMFGGRWAMRSRWACRISALMLGLTLTAPHPASTSERIGVDGSTGVMPLVAALAKAYQERHPAAVVEIGKGLGTKARLQALEEGRIDIALASHGLVVEELSRRGMAVHEIAKVAVVVGVNASVPVANLTDAQVCEIYARRVTSWKVLGGPDIAIAPRTRPDSEVDTEVVRGKIACLKDLKMPDGVKVMPRSGDMAKELAATVGAVGITTATVVEQSQGQIKVVSLNGIIPSVENVGRKTYTLTRDSFLVTKATPPPTVAKFIEFVRSSAGAAVIVANGAVPVK